jgi:hypothetical protein
MKNAGDFVVYAGEIVEVRSVDTVSGRYLLACRDGSRWVRFDECVNIADTLCAA